jgi:LysR family hydrogen peroxide-inducible transcriptional activator
MRVTLKQLRYFDALAELLHFGKAAEACAISQPALSMQIQDLENELGTPLVERRHSGVVLTENGRDVARRTKQILGEIHDMVDFARHRSQVLTGPLRLGVIPSVAPYLLPPLLPLLKESYPELQLNLRETQTATLLNELEEHKLDAILIALPVERPNIETMRLFEDRLVLAVPKSCVSEGGGDTDRLIANERLLLLEEGHCLREQALSYCRRKKVETVYTFGTSSLSTIVRMVASGHGITLLPELCLSMEVRGDELRIIRFGDPEPSRALALAWRSTSPRKADFTALGRLVATLGARRDPNEANIGD